MGTWYRTGTVAVTNGSPDVVGVGTLMLSQASVGDIWVGPDLLDYEITAIADDTHWSIKQRSGTAAYAGATASAQPHAVIRNFTSTLPAKLASDLAGLMTKYHITLDEMVAWLSGTGSVTLHDAVGNAYTVKTPAALQAALEGRLVKSVAGGSDVSLTSAEASNQMIEFTGTLSANINVIVPATARANFFYNATSGAYTLVVKTASGTGVAVPQGGRVLLECDGTNVVNPLANIPGNQTVTGVLIAGALTTTGSVSGVSGGGSTGGGIFGNASSAAYAIFYGSAHSANPNYAAYYGTEHRFKTVAGADLTAITTAGITVAGGVVATGATVGKSFTFSGTVASDYLAYIKNSQVGGNGYGLLIDAGSSNADVALKVRDATGASSLLVLDGAGTLGLGATNGSYHVVAKNSVANYVLSAQNLATSGGAHCMYAKLGYSPNDTTSSLYIGGDTTTTRYVVWSNGNVQNTNNSYGAISDLKLKQDIADAKSQWGDVKALRVRKFRLKIDPTGPLMMGLVAQEAALVSPGLIETTDDYEEVVVEPARTEIKIVQRQKTRKVTVEQPTPTLVDGRYVLLMVPTEIDEPVIEEHPLFAEDGSPIMEIVEPEQLAVTDEEGNVVTPGKPAVLRQAVHRVPVMEEAEDALEIPAKTERRPTGTQTKSVKYSILYMKAVKALQEAMERIETLEAEVAALKGV